MYGCREAAEHLSATGHPISAKGMSKYWERYGIGQKVAGRIIFLDADLTMVLERIGRRGRRPG